MRKRTANLRGSAKVIPMTGLAPRARIEAGILLDDEGNGVGVYVETHGRFRMTADQAEALAADLMQFVHELRNGGKFG